ncbi:MAG: ParB N-terminal domain-containing protein [Candidatus Aenigmatarchaeota archaeon]
MEIQRIKIKELKEWKNNPRYMSDADFEALKKSIKNFGFVEPLVINREKYIIGGNHRYKAIKELYGNDYEIDCIIVDNLTKEQENLLNLALNKIHGQFDYDKLQIVLNDISNQQAILDIGFTQDELKMLNIDVSLKVDDNILFGLREVKEGDDVICPKCGYNLGIKKRTKGKEVYDATKY